MLLLSYYIISNKEELFIFSTNKVAVEEALEVHSLYSIQALTSITSTQLSLVNQARDSKELPGKKVRWVDQRITAERTNSNATSFYRTHVKTTSFYNEESCRQSG